MFSPKLQLNKIINFKTQDLCRDFFEKFSSSNLANWMRL